MRESKESDYMSAVQALIRGEKLYTVSSRYGIYHYKLQLLRKRYENRGLPGLLEPGGLRRYNLEDHLSILRDIEQNHIPFHRVHLLSAGEDDLLRVVADAHWKELTVPCESWPASIRSGFHSSRPVHRRTWRTSCSQERPDTSA